MLGLAQDKSKQAHDTLVVSNSFYTLCSQCPCLLLPGTLVLMLYYFPSFNTSCALSRSPVAAEAAFVQEGL